MSGKAFRIATDDDLRGLGYGSHWDAFKFLIGPDGWHCHLGEPEDCIWSRDGQDAVDMLNAQADRIATLEAELIALRAAAEARP